MKDNHLISVRGFTPGKNPGASRKKKGSEAGQSSTNATNTGKRASKRVSRRQSRGTKLQTAQRKSFIKKLRSKSLKADSLIEPSDSTEDVKPTLEAMSEDVSAGIGQFTQDPEAQRRRLKAEFHTVQMKTSEHSSRETPKLNLKEFTKLLNLIQVTIKDSELIGQLFEKCDMDGDSLVSLDEFIDTFLPSNRLRMRKTRRRKKKKFFCHRLENYPPCLKQIQPKSIESLHFLLRDKIMKTVSRDSDLFRQVFLAFQAQRGENIQEQGINFEGFSRVLQNYGIFVTETVCREFFNRFDIDGNGTITLHEFVTGIMPHDYPLNSVLPPVNHYGENERILEREDHHVRTLPATLQSFRWTIPQLNMHVQNKISERVSRDSDRFRQVFSIFEAQRGGDVYSQGIGPEGLARLLLDFGIILLDEQLLEWFHKLDMDGDGTVSLYEFMQATMPKDYPNPSNPLITKNRVFGKTRRGSDSEFSDSEEEEETGAGSVDAPPTDFSTAFKKEAKRARRCSKKQRDPCTSKHCRHRRSVSPQQQPKGEVTAVQRGGVDVKEKKEPKVEFDILHPTLPFARTRFFKPPVVSRAPVMNQKKGLKVVADLRRRSSWWDDQMQKGDRPSCSGGRCRHYHTRKSVFEENDTILRDLHH